MCVGSERCQIREIQKMTACRHFFVFFLFDRVVLGAGGTCLARTEAERRTWSVAACTPQKIKYGLVKVSTGYMQLEKRVVWRCVKWPN